MRLAFTKMHGAGNDFIVLDATRGSAIPEPEQLRRLAQRQTGIGFDQALILEPAKSEGALVGYRIFNSDGDEVEQYGNGARCIAALLFRRGAPTSGAPMRLDSAAGPVLARLDEKGRVSVNMGVPNFEPAALPFVASHAADDYVLEVDGETIHIGAVSMGNPHAVIEVPSVDTAPVARLGPAIEHHPRFPRRVNVGFMQIMDRTHIRLRVYERGAGETLACGTGACAAVVVGRARRSLDESVQVSVRGGELRVNWTGMGEPVWLTGPAEVSFEGYVDI